MNDLNRQFITGTFCGHCIVTLIKKRRADVNYFWHGASIPNYNWSMQWVDWLMVDSLSAVKKSVGDLTITKAIHQTILLYCTYRYSREGLLLLRSNENSKKKRCWSSTKNWKTYPQKEGEHESEYSDPFVIIASCHWSGYISWSWGIDTVRM